MKFVIYLNIGDLSTNFFSMFQVNETQWAGKWPLTIFATKQLKQDFYFIV